MVLSVIRCHSIHHSYHQYSGCEIRKTVYELKYRYYHYNSSLLHSHVCSCIYCTRLETGFTYKDLFQWKTINLKTYFGPELYIVETFFSSFGNDELFRLALKKPGKIYSIKKCFNFWYFDLKFWPPTGCLKTTDKRKNGTEKVLLAHSRPIFYLVFNTMVPILFLWRLRNIFDLEIYLTGIDCFIYIFFWVGSTIDNVADNDTYISDLNYHRGAKSYNIQAICFEQEILTRWRTTHNFKFLL